MRPLGRRRRLRRSKGNAIPAVRAVNPSRKLLHCSSNAKDDAMARYGIPRHRFGVNDNEQELINWRRGLFRVWVLLSVAWMMGWTIFLLMQGIQGGLQTTGDFLEIP